MRKVDFANGKLSIPDMEKPTQLSYRVLDARNNVVVKSTKVDLKSSFCFDFDFELPGTINLGNTNVEISWEGETRTHSVQVSEYKRKGNTLGYTASF